MTEIHRVNWVICPKCKYRYYVEPELLLEDISAECPKCHTEFDAKGNRESPLTEQLQQIKRF
ncbi:hypothetical protein ACFLYI_00445 [Chloroflexota bacterium]